jgi:hypothetical protein
VISAIRQVAPHVDTTDPSWLVLQGPDHLMEVSLGKDEDVDGFTFFVRGGEGSVPLMAAIADAVGATLFDTSTGELVTAESGAASLLAWRRYRDQVVGANPPAETPAPPESDGGFVIGGPARVRGRYSPTGNGRVSNCASVASGSAVGGFCVRWKLPTVCLRPRST